MNIAILLLTLTVIAEGVVAVWAVKEWGIVEEDRDVLKTKFSQQFKEVAYRGLIIRMLATELSKKPHRCAECGKLHMAEKQILSGKMPGETYCDEHL